MRPDYPMPWSWAVIFLALCVPSVHAQTYSAIPRWGQASAVIYDLLFIHGGKTDPSHQYTYNSAPNSNDLLTLDLSSPFSLSAPPWTYVSGSQNTSTSQGPAVAFHTLTPYTTSQMLLFGGDAGFATIGTNADSAWLLNVNNRMAPAWTSENTGWASEPMRRIYHAASSASGAIYILGGQKGDSSQLGFLDSYLFNAVGTGGSPAFISLQDSSSGPAGLFGHAGHVLPGGILVVFGGFFTSSNIPSPFTIIYILDTTSPSPSWSVHNASGTAPSPRRGFASALLDDGRIFIHGGADATMQVVYNDGAVLDTTQSPMTWSPVTGLSSGLGSRVGHFAIPIQDRILFGFGWTGNAPAAADISLYNPASNSFESTYMPPATPVSVTTLPVSPTAPGGTYPSSGTGAGKGGPGVGPSPTSPFGSKPTSGNGHGQNGSGNGGSDGTPEASKGPVASVVVGTVLGVLAFVAFAGAGAYYVIRKREGHVWMGNRNRKDAEGRSRLMPHDEMWDADESSTQLGEMVQMAGSRWEGQPRRGWGLLNLGVGGKWDNKTPRRFDMLADEDARQFDVDEAFDETEWSTRDVSLGRRREGTGGSSLSFGAVGTGRPPWYDMLNASVTSLRNMGASLGVSAAATKQGRTAGRTLNSTEFREKDELVPDPFSDSAAMDQKVKQPTTMGMTAMQPQGEQYMQNAAVPNPFSDTAESGQDLVDARDVTTYSLPGDVHGDITTTVRGDEPAMSSQTSLPKSVGFVASSTNVTTRSDASASVESHNAPSTNSNSNSNTSTSIAISSLHPSSNENSSNVSSPTSPRTTSIIGASAPTVPMRRSDSWWTRFRSTSFRDRHSSHDSSRATRTGGDALIDFRDPNPMPRLGAIEEHVQSNQSSPETVQDIGLQTTQGSKQRRKSGSGYAASTRSSLKTDYTADSELMERMGGKLEVMQRALSLHSHHAASSSTVLDSPSILDNDTWGLSTIEAGGSGSSHEKLHTESSTDVESSVVESPTDIDLHSDRTFANTATRANTAAPSIPSSPNTESGVQAPIRPHPPRRTLTGAVAARVSAYERRISQEFVQNTPSMDERTRRGGVGYGIVPKAPLFVANPDRRKSSGST